MLTLSMNAHSGPLRRLRQMSQNIEDTLSVPPLIFDNCLRSQIQGFACLRRIKHAGLVGKVYWNRERYTHINSAHEPDWSSLLLGLGTPKARPFLQLMRKDPELCNGWDFAQVDVGMGLDLNCFNSFLERAVNEEVEGEYRLKPAMQSQSISIESPQTNLVSVTSVFGSNLHGLTILPNHFHTPLMIAPTAPCGPATQKVSRRGSAKLRQAGCIEIEETPEENKVKEPKAKRSKKSSSEAKSDNSKGSRKRATSASGVATTKSSKRALVLA